MCSLFVSCFFLGSKGKNLVTFQNSETDCSEIPWRASYDSEDETDMPSSLLETFFGQEELNSSFCFFLFNLNPLK